MGSDTDYDLITQDDGDPDDIVVVSANERYRGSTWQDRLNQQTGANLPRDAVFVLSE
jgi:hypothetical protein